MPSKSENVSSNDRPIEEEMDLFSSDTQEDDGGLPPGGAPEQQPCNCGPCPACAEDRQLSNPCLFQLGHQGDHECIYGDIWIQADPADTPKRKYCGAACPEPACGKSCTRQFIHPTPHMCPLGHTW